MIRAALKDEGGRIAEVHLAAFPGFFLSAMGRKVLARFYEALIGDARCLVLVATDTSGRLIGFSAGSVRGGRLGGILMLNLGFLWAVFLELLKRRELWRKVTNCGRRLKRPDNQDDGAALWSIGVDPSVGGKGVGFRLLTAFEAGCTECGSRIVCLTTDAQNNGKAINFYLRNGYRIVGQWSEDRRELVFLRKDLRTSKE